jgi:SNF2 family DNA or RNA helicase
VLGRIKRMIELTGTPASNGYMDIWSQIYLLDKGEALGKNITQYRARYFTSDYMGFNYVLRSGMDKVIEHQIKKMILSMSAEDYLELPPVISDVLYNKLEGDLLKKYKTLEKDMIVNMSSEDRITAMSVATLSNKLLQFCSGNIYDEVGTVVKVHSLKIDTLKEIIEENQGENILVAYNYKHELESLRKAFPDAKVLDKDGKLVTEWNKGKISLLLCHPLSAGHGLNLQDGGSIVVWYGFTWSLELYQQFNARLNRQGQKNTVRIFHIAVGDIENKLMKTLSSKEATQDGLLEAIKYGK